MGVRLQLRQFHSREEAPGRLSHPRRPIGPVVVVAETVEKAVDGEDAKLIGRSRGILGTGPLHRDGHVADPPACGGVLRSLTGEGEDIGGGVDAGVGGVEPSQFGVVGKAHRQPRSRRHPESLTTAAQQRADTGDPDQCQGAGVEGFGAMNRDPHQYTLTTFTKERTRHGEPDCP